jgi:hypothetical protein
VQATEQGGFERIEIANMLKELCLRLNANNGSDLARLVDVLKLHGFLPSCDSR